MVVIFVLVVLLLWSLLKGGKGAIQNRQFQCGIHRHIGFQHDQQ